MLKGRAFSSGHTNQSTVVLMGAYVLVEETEQKQDNRQTSYELCRYFKGNRTGKTKTKGSGR